MNPSLGRLSKLPRELRDEIYDLVLFSDFRWRYSSIYFGTIIPLRENRIPPLLKTSRQLKDEGSQLYLRGLTVFVDCSERAVSAFLKWLDYFGPLTRYLGNIRFPISSRDAGVYMAAMTKDNRPMIATSAYARVPIELHVVMPEHHQPTTSSPGYLGPRLYFGYRHEPYDPDLAATISHTISTAEELASSEDFLRSIGVVPQETRHAMVALQAIARHSVLFANGKKMHIEAWSSTAIVMAKAVRQGGTYAQWYEDWVSGRDPYFSWG
ncbi:hypothetical protein MBLNU457_7135t1 [Dothideomycetes sp. NU457]